MEGATLSPVSEKAGRCWRQVVATTQLGRASLGERTHVVYALSKDFALSGLRVGVLYTEARPHHTTPTLTTSRHDDLDDEDLGVSDIEEDEPDTGDDDDDEEE